MHKLTIIVPDSFIFFPSRIRIVDGSKNIVYSNPTACLLKLSQKTDNWIHVKDFKDRKHSQDMIYFCEEDTVHKIIKPVQN